MPLIPPRLDDRNFEGLVAELVARIPAHTPEWTNPRVGDPGRTLIELFAWLGDTLLYRANLIPERQRLVFLKLLGIQVRPAIAAKGMVTVAFTEDGVPSPITLRRGATVSGPPNFETSNELTVLPISGQVFVKRTLSEEEQVAMGPIVNDLKELYQSLRPDEDAEAAIPYVTTPIFDDAALAYGYDIVADTPDRALWVALLAPTPEDLVAARTTLEEGADGRPFTLNVGFVPMVAPVETLDELPVRRPIAHIWELSTLETIEGETVYRGLDVVRDTTNGLTRQGVIQLALTAQGLDAPSNDTRVSPTAGMGDQAPPRVDDPELGARLIAWIRLRPTERLQSLPITWVGINAVEIEQVQTTRGVVAGQSDGTADQVIKLPATSVDPTSLALQVDEGERGFQLWQRVDDVNAFGRDARVYSLDSEAGTVRFGDGVRGRVPESGKRIRVAEMRAGGGAQGNLPPNTLTAISGRAPNGDQVLVPLEVTQPLVTRGGANAETLLEAERRIPASLRHRNRAVTESDFRMLAASTPGVFVGRVETLPRFKPQQRREDVPGVVSVMVLPVSRSQGAQPPAPRPDRPFLETVHAWLDNRRTVGTELYVIGPEYVPIGISAGIDIRNGFEQEQTLAAVRLALRAFLWALPPGGVQGTGWELGTTVLASQLEVTVARVPGVSVVRGVRLFGRVNDDWSAAPTVTSGTQGVRLQPWQLPELLSVVVLAGADAPDNLRGVPNPFRTGAGGDGTGGDGTGGDGTGGDGTGGDGTGGDGTGGDGTAGDGTGTGGGVGIGIPVVPEVC